MQLLALSESNFALDAAILQVDLGRDEGQSFFLRLSEKLVDLAPVQQQLSAADGRVILTIAVGILADVRVIQPRFILVDLGIAFTKLDFAAAGRLDLGPRQDHPGLKTVQQEVVVPGLPVVAQDFDSTGLDSAGLLCQNRVPLSPSGAKIVLHDTGPDNV